MPDPIKERAHAARRHMKLNTVSTNELQAELARREKAGRELIGRREKLVRELAAIDAELAAVGAAPAVRRTRSAATGAASDPAAPGAGTRQRARNDISLADALVQAMEVRAVVTPAEAAELVRRNGYTSTAKNFGMMVSNALARDPRFKRLARGKYERIE